MLATLVSFGVDVVVGFLPFDSMVSRAGNGSAGVADVAAFLGLVLGATGLFIGVLMFQIAFTHLVGYRLCATLRVRHAALAPPPRHGAFPPR
ncbi:hypothetical protein [Streptomyces sp. NPDC127092]|uniref:hypothetical protein n=1 Tax=Streptomyces sp. NPDC127092 TaxID=3347135 RepID=UPI003665DD60